MSKQIADIYPVSPLQEGILFHSVANPHGHEYVVQVGYLLHGPLDVVAYQEAWQRVVDRHPVLRTSFLWQRDDRPLQVVRHEARVPWQVEDWRHLPDGERHDRRRTLIEADRKRDFDLSKAPLLRFTLIRLADQLHYCLFTHHHIVMDGWSVAIVFKEVVDFYNALVAGGRPRAEPVRPYGDFIKWLQTQDTSEAEAFWRKTLRGLSEVTSLESVCPPAGAAPASPGRSVDRYAERSVDLPAAVSDGLPAMLRRCRLTASTVFQGAWAILLSRYSGDRDVIFGTTSSGRPPELAGVEAMVGPFISTMPVRVAVADDESVAAWLGRLQDHQSTSRRHDHTPLTEIHAYSDLPPGRPLFESLFVFENYPLDDSVLNPSGPLRMEVVDVIERANYPIGVVANRLKKSSVTIIFDTVRFDSATIERMLGHFNAVLHGIIADPDRRPADVPMLTEPERRRLVHTWNDTAADYPREKCIHELFEEQATRTPDATAVLFGNRPLTYGDLNARANQLARHLKDSGVGPETLVGLHLERGIEMIVGLLGVLKAQGTFLPLDPEYPPDRLDFMIADAKVALVLSQQRIAGRLKDRGFSVVRLDTEWARMAGQPEQNLEVPSSADDLAYVIYTSGSTGTPKGAEILHRGLVNMSEQQVRLFAAGPGSRVLQFSSFNFDASIFEIVMALRGGATLCLVEKEAVLPGPGLAELLGTLEITHLTIPPSLLAAVPSADLPALRVLCVAGEACPAELVSRWAPGRRFYNLYGPTEATIWATWHECTEASGPPPIGRPIGNVEVYLLDDQRRPVPVGLPGEMYIGGVGLARGYLNRPALTAEKFVDNPFDKRPGSRLYRSGDVCRRRPDGNLEFVGRIDDQVKVRGFRIELGEIEAVIRKHPAVREAVVVAREDAPGDKRLAAYVVFADEERGRKAELRDHLKDKLPSYMLPSSLVVLDALPLSPSGKVDRQALPAPGRQAEDAYVAPRGKLERALVGIWKDVLKVDRVGVHDNFFEAGGNSLLLMQLHSKLHRRLECEMSIADLFRYPTIDLQARHVAGEMEHRSLLRFAKARIEKRRHDAAREGHVAVVGMAGRVPGANDLETFWANLREGVESIRTFTDDELRQAGVNEAALKDPRYVKAFGHLSDADLFDAAHFGYSPREAERIDPQQRIFLECAWEALERAGYDPQQYGGPIGVYAGSGLNTYACFLHPHDAGGFSDVISSDKDFLATRVSYKLNLRGPAVTVQTACSTSLVAVHQACRSLLDFECDVALAGGVAIGVPLESGYLYEEGGILSPDGHCRAFDARAQGTVGGSGAGVVVLKRLEDALRDGDTIEAVILGTAINNDGAMKVGYTAPSVEGQAEVVALAQAAAGVDPDTISYVEAHGTGTALGDPIEVAALSQVFLSSAGRRRSCALGSLKTNVGHLDAAAGVAGLIKTILSLKHRKLVPSLHFEQPSAEIDFDDGPFYVNTESCPWQPDGDGPLRAGVSSFGIGGTNAHVVVEEPPPTEPAAPSRPLQLITVSARTASALDRAASNLARHLKRHGDLPLADAAYTLHVGRRDFAHRRAFLCRDTADAAEALETADPRRTFAGQCESSSRPVVFMFTGQGAQYPGVAGELYASEPVFRDVLDRCCEILSGPLDHDLRDVLFPTAAGEDAQREAARRLSRTEFTQPALFVVEYALAQLWISWGIRPAAMIGHSIGEYVAACLAGVLGLEDALALVAARGRLMGGLPRGSMLAVRAPRNELEPLLGEELSLAAINGPSLSVISGASEAVEEAEAKLRQRGLAPTRLRTSHAFHSPMMEPIVGPFAREVEKVRLGAAEIPYVSNLTGTWITQEEATDPAYWAGHLRGTVQFSAGLEALFDEPDRILLEVGPDRTLRSLARAHPAKPADVPVLHSLRRKGAGGSDVASMLESLGRLWVLGVQPDWAGFHAHEKRRRVPLPTYPFERQRYWVESRRRPDREPLRQGPRKKPDMADWFYVPSWRRSAPRSLTRSPRSPQQACRLIFGGESGIGPGLAARLEQMRHDVVTVIPGERFAKLNEQEYVLNPRRSDQYAMLLDELRAADKMPNKIAHLWSTQPQAAAGGDSFEQRQYLGAYSLLYLAQALGKQEPAGPFQVWAVSSNLYDVTGSETSCPETATLLGPCRVIPQEFANIACSNIDVVLPAPGTPQEHTLIEQLAAEMDVAPDDMKEMVVAYRGAHRWVESYEPIRLEADAHVETRLRERGVYLITGGLGRVGLAVAEFLARSVRAKLVLTGRHGLPPRDAWDGWLAPLEDERCRARAEDEQAFIREAEKTINDQLQIKGIKDYPGLADALNALCTSYAYDYLKRNGVDVTKGRIYSRADLKSALNVSPSFEKLYECMVTMLADDGIVACEGDAVEFVTDPNTVEDPSLLCRRAEQAYPQFKGLLDHLGHCVAHYDGALSGAIDAVSVLYPDGSGDLLKKVDAETVEHTQERAYRTLLKEMLSHILRESHGKKMRILEVGGGQGALTDLLVPALQKHNVEYCFTDIGRAFVLKAEELAKERGLDFMKFGTLDISKDPAPQGYGQGSFDVVVGLNVVHATKDIEETVHHLKSLLAPGGRMLLVEAVRSQRWIDMTTGLAEGWWYFDDRVRRDSPLIDLAEWERVCQGQGLRAAAFPQGEKARSETDHGLIVVQQQAEAGVHPGRDGEGGDRNDRERRTRNAIRKVTELEKLGAEVFVAGVDVADLEQMRSLVAEVEGRYGKLNGVIHAAGCTESDAFAFVKDARLRHFDAHFRPKVHGLRVLDELLRDKDLDFRVLMSSNASVLGGLKSVAYTAANAFMDAFAHGGSTNEGGRWVSTNWDRWGHLEELDAEQDAGHARSIAEYAMSLEEAVEAFRRILSIDPVTQVVVSTGDLRERVDEWVGPGPWKGGGGVERKDAPTLHTRPALRTDFVAPRNAVEEALAEIWSHVLGVEQVGVHDNFFEFGGDSILSIQISAKARQSGLQLATNQVFEHPTIAELAEMAGTTSRIASEQGVVTGPVCLTPIQQWFFEQDFPEPDHFNLTITLDARETLDATLLERAVQQLAVHHDALRLRFAQKDCRWRQFNAGVDDPVLFRRVDLSGMPEAEREKAAADAAARLNAGLNLSEGPVVAVAVFDFGAGRPGRLLIAVHHLVVDAVSCRMLLEDLQTAYRQLSRNEAVQLPAKTTAFTQWARRLAEYAQSEALGAEIGYWVSPKPVPALPVDYAEGSNTVESACCVSASLDTDETSVLLQEVPRAYNSQITDVLITALARTLWKWNGSRSQRIALEGHGREGILEGVDLSRTVGWFTTFFPVSLDLGEDSNPGKSLKAVKEQLRRVPNQGIGYGLLRYSRRDRETAARLNAVAQPEVSFAYLGRFDQVFAESSPFGLAENAVGLSRALGGARSHLLEAHGVVIDGRLQMNWWYSRNVHRRETIEALADDFLAELRWLIDHCRSPEAGGYTPSDFTASNLSQADLETIARKMTRTGAGRNK